MAATYFVVVSGQKILQQTSTDPKREFRPYLNETADFNILLSADLLKIASLIYIEKTDCSSDFLVRCVLDSSADVTRPASSFPLHLDFRLGNRDWHTSSCSCSVPPKRLPDEATEFASRPQRRTLFR
jgi:hypothetical protein